MAMLTMKVTSHEFVYNNHLQTAQLYLLAALITLVVLLDFEGKSKINCHQFVVVAPDCH